MFTAALSTITNMWKHPKCPSTEEWIKKMCYVCIMEYSAIQKNEILPFKAMRMDLEGIMLNEISQTEKDKYCMLSLICETYKIIQMDVYSKTGTDSQIQRRNS